MARNGGASRALAALLPAEIRCASSLLSGDPEPSLAALLEDERACVARAIAKRRREFALGRELARELLRELGFPDQPLLPGPDRAPLWPGGILGSIAHDARQCLVAIARSGAIAGVGVDVEPAAPLEERLWGPICTESERRALAADAPLPAGLRARAIFCAKEALYKCLHPALGWPRGFHDVEIALQADARLFAAAPARAAGERDADGEASRRSEILGRVEGVLLLDAGEIATACWWIAHP